MTQSARYIDVHTHLTHDKFSSDLDSVIAQCEEKKMHVVVNGLNPRSNRFILDLARKYSCIVAATGIYPVDSVHKLIDGEYAREVERFDVDKEIAYIKEKAKNKEIAAVGECGLDGYILSEHTFKEQERVWRELVQIAIDSDIPVIVHSRKLERRCLEILDDMQAQRVDMHCFTGKSNLAQKYAEKNGWCFSIPANISVSQSFQSLVKKLPITSILTETDAPYLAPVRGERNEPINVIHTVDVIAQLRNMTHQEAKEQIWKNYQQLFYSLE